MHVIQNEQYLNRVGSLTSLFSKDTFNLPFCADIQPVQLSVQFPVILANTAWPQEQSVEKYICGQLFHKFIIMTLYIIIIIALSADL